MEKPNLRGSINKKASSVAVNVSTVAALLSDPTRTTMLMTLMNGQAFTAGELAKQANVSPQTASSHLKKLLEGGLLALESQGRHRYYRLAHAGVAEVLETLGTFSSVKPFTPRVPPELRYARLCYDHLAGQLGVSLTDGLLHYEYLSEDFSLTERGRAWFTHMAINVDVSRRQRFTKACLDWSERRPHLGGTLGQRFMQRLLELGWIVRLGESRCVRLTFEGQRQLEKELGLKLERLKAA
jgi:DNA-binding transcriptional ArsR family regulator